MTICLLFGGVSPEHEVALRSADTIIENYDSALFDLYTVGITRDGNWFLYTGPREKIRNDSWLDDPELLYPAVLSPSRGDGLIVFEKDGIRRIPVDCVFPALHGENGEDGSIQGLCRVAGLPIVGSPTTASAVCMDKALTKLIVSNLKIPQAKYIAVTRAQLDTSSDELLKTVADTLGYPVFVKPAGTGSSVGVAKVRDPSALIAAVSQALRYDSTALIEEFIDGREIETAVLGNLDPVVSVCGEIVPGDEFYSYDDKYINDTAYSVIPADLPPETADLIRGYARRIYLASGCRGLSRADFFVHKQTGKAYFNEINTLPGFTSISMFPKLMIFGGMSIREQITALIKLACEDSPVQA